KFISDNLVYPEYARRYRIQGVVFVEFTVTSHGDIVDVRVLKPINEYLDAEAVRVVGSSPKWEVPGKYDGKTSDSKMTLPITFKLEEETVRKDIAEEVFIIVEEMPRFGDGPDGPANFRSYIAENLVYPPEAAKQGIQGLVFVQFTVNSKGFVENVKIVRGIHELLDAEAIRVVMESPQWTPGRQRGKEVNVQYTFPINFVLGETNTE
ncbi:MAG TPA: energy transducer TonB, partial [Bacteroidales bacterium]|nr:energy transducer TonB [Bacteroidales bacterium]